MTAPTINRHSRSLNETVAAAGQWGDLSRSAHDRSALTVGSQLVNVGTSAMGHKRRSDQRRVNLLARRLRLSSDHYYSHLGTSVGV